MRSPADRSAEDELGRWREASRDPRALSARAADLVEAVRAVPPLSPQVMARIEGDVIARRPSRSRGLPLGMRLAFLTVLVLASVATARGTMTLWHRYVNSDAAAPARPEAPARHAISKPRPAPRAPEVLPLPPPEAAVAAAAPVHVAAAHARRTAMAMPEPRVERNDDASAASEAPLLARALSRLRQGRDPAGALVLLDQYTHTFPHGVLESEALSARLEAVIQLDDRETALRLLDARSVFAGRLGAQLLLTRAELRASAGRYADALTDFERLLAPSQSAGPAELERALYGRAVCLGHLGKDDRARADLDTYQRRFPQGKHAAEVARLLKGTGPERRP
jgi:hypothetical protein